MKIGKTFHFVASIISFCAFFAMFLPIVNLSTSVSMLQSAFGINCTATWSNTVIFFLQIINMIIFIFVFVSFLKKYENYEKVKFLRIVHLTLSFFQILFAFLTTTIIGVPSGYGISLGAGPIIYGITYLVSDIFIILSFVYCAKKDSALKLEKDSFSVSKSKERSSELEKAELLIKYKELLDKKVITKKEFEEKKKELLK